MPGCQCFQRTTLLRDLSSNFLLLLLCSHRLACPGSEVQRCPRQPVSSIYRSVHPYQLKHSLLVSRLCCRVQIHDPRKFRFKAKQLEWNKRPLTKAAAQILVGCTLGWTESRHGRGQLLGSCLNHYGPAWTHQICCGAVSKWTHQIDTLELHTCTRQLRSHHQCT